MNTNNIGPGLGSVFDTIKKAVESVRFIAAMTIATEMADEIEELDGKEVADFALLIGRITAILDEAGMLKLPDAEEVAENADAA